MEDSKIRDEANHGTRDIDGKYIDAFALDYGPVPIPGSRGAHKYLHKGERNVVNHVGVHEYVRSPECVTASTGRDEDSKVLQQDGDFEQ